jgi:outer membrane protein TolC
MPLPKASRLLGELGAISYILLLNAEQTYQQARIALVQAQANRFADTAALFQALGGGWWNRTDVLPEAAADERAPVEKAALAGGGS